MAEFFHSSIGLPEWLAVGLTALVHAFLLINFMAFLPVFFIWLERKVSGRLQDRLGPTRVGGKFGWLQTIADVLKLLQKEDIAPGAADVFLFKLAPYMVFVASFSAFIALPFSDGWVAQNLDIAAFFILAVLSLEVFGIIIAGWASGSKWSLFGGMREAAQMVSYEVPLALCAVIPVLAAGTMNLNAIGNAQAGGPWNWLIFHDPFTFLAFWVFFACAMASVKRAPYDLAEAESELVAGFHTEYSGMRWSFFFLAEYASMFVVSGLAVVLFLGGWHGPIPIATWLGLTYDNGPLAGYVGNFLGMLNFIGKSFFLVFVMMWVRWTLPRLRIDQVMKTCLKYYLPISCFLLFGAAGWPLVMYQVFGRTSTPWQGPVQPAAAVAAPAEAGVVAERDGDDRTPVSGSAESPRVATRGL